MSFPNKYGTNQNKAQATAEITTLCGGIYIGTSDTDTHEGPFSHILALAAAVADLTSDASQQGIQGTMTDVALPAGVLVPGPFDTIKRDSGGAIFAYFLAR